VEEESKMTAGVKRFALSCALVIILAAAVAFAFLNRSVPETNALWPSLPFQSEDQWIVSQTAVSVIDFAQYARTGKAAPLSTLAISRMHADPARPALTFRVGSHDVAVSLATHVWDPDAYVELARREGASGQPGPVNDDIVNALLDLKLDTLRVQNDTVSIALQRDYRNPANHEAAAMLLAAFALREASGYFYDPRLVLSRAAAHLAVARAMRGGTSEPSDAGRLAAVMIDIDAGRTGPAVATLDALDRAHPIDAAQSWARALRRRATMDWRMVPDDRAPLIERLEYMRSVARMLGVSNSLEYIEHHDAEAVPDWGWRTLDFPMSVASGHVFVDDTIERTLSEAAAVLGVSRSPARGDLVAMLSREPAVSSIGRRPGRGIEVLDEGTWSAFYQRELAHVAMQGSEFYRGMLGAPDMAEKFERQVDALMGATPLWPIVLRLRIESECRCAFKEERLPKISATYRETMARMVPLIRQTPQRVPFLAWTWVEKSPHPSIAPINIIQPNQWFRTIYPTGTTFESRRMNAQRIIPNDFVAQADALHALAPWDPLVTINWSLITCRHGCTAEQERANFANIAEIHLTTMERFAERTGDPAASYRRICEIASDRCYGLADWYKSHDQFGDAAAASQQFFDRALDRVAASNGIEWLVRYYQKTGQAVQARRVAHAAADVGSARGIAALAGVYEREGNTAKARELFRQIFERYDEGEYLLSYLLRRADVSGTAASGTEYETLVQRYFDGTPESVATASLSGRPARGLMVRGVSTWNSKYFRKGDVIVAMDGVRVWKTRQASIQYERSFDAPLRYTVWRGNEYIDVVGPFRSYYYGVDAVEDPPRK
jgi:hypothetical protein